MNTSGSWLMKNEINTLANKKMEWHEIVLASHTLIFFLASDL